MILADSSIWIDHLRTNDPILFRLLNEGRILGHPFVLGEVALGSISRRDVVLAALAGLPQTIVAEDKEVFALIERNRLSGRGIGYVDVHLLAAARLTAMATLWTRDKRLQAAAEQMEVAAQLD